MAYKLVVSHEFHDRALNRVMKPGDHIYHQGHVERLSEERERNCVRVVMTPEEEAEHLAKPAKSSSK